MRKCISHHSGGWKSKIRMPTWSCSGEDPSGSQTSDCSMFLDGRIHREETSVLLTHTYKVTDPIHEGSTFRPSFNPNYFTEVPPPNIIILEGRVWA